MRAIPWTLCVVIFVSLALPAAGNQQDYRLDRTRPAVTAPHGLLELRGEFREEAMPDTRRAMVRGEYNFGLPRPFPKQIGFTVGTDLGVGFAGDGAKEAIGVHSSMFWRDFRLAFAGIGATYVRLGSNHSANVSAIGGYYLGDFDITAVAGYEDGSGIERGVFRAEGAWYPTRDIRLGGEVLVGTKDALYGEGRVYWQPKPKSNPVSFRLALGGGEIDRDRFYSISLGIAVHFASGKSLMRQIREDRLIVFD